MMKFGLLPKVAVCMAPVILFSVVWYDAAAEPSPDRAYIDSVIDSLVGAGVLTQEQADQMRARAAEAARMAAEQATAAAKPPAKKWYDRMKVSGFVQGRYELYTNAEDREADSAFRARRARVKFQFSPSQRATVDVEGDFAEGKAEPRDVFVTYTALTDDRGTGRVRLGQYKLPFGFEIPQPASIRIPLETSWQSRYMFPGERDTGILFMWTRPEDRAIFDLGRQFHLGPGDYGTVALSFVNGQGLNNSERNSNKHIVARVAKPFEVEIGDQSTYAEVGASFFSGRYVSSAATPNPEFQDRVFGVHAYLAPNPFGFQGEYCTGETEGGDVDGWYIMGLWRSKPGSFAYLRHDAYNGPRKGNGTATDYDLRRTSIGYAHALDERTRLTVEYDHVQAEPDAAAADDDMLGVQLMVTY